MQRLSKILLILLFFGFSVGVDAQIGEPRTQIAVGVNGGVALNSMTFAPSINQSQHIGPTMGLTFRVTSEKYFSALCALQLELNYTRLGWTEDIIDAESNPLPDRYRRDLDYAQLPLLARLGWGREERGFQFFFLLGPQVGWLMGERTTRSDAWTLTPEGVPDRPGEVFQQYDLPVERRFEYGITGGIGVELSTRAGHFLVEGRYYYGLSDIYGNAKADAFSRSSHGTIFAKVSYLFNLRK